MTARVRIFCIDCGGQHADRIDEQKVVLMRRFLEPFDRSFDRRRHRVEIFCKLADLVVRLQLQTLLIIPLGNGPRPLREHSNRPGDAGSEDNRRDDGQAEGDGDPFFGGVDHLRNRREGHRLRFLDDHAPLRPSDRGDRAEHHHSLAATRLFIRFGQSNRRFGELLNDLQRREIGTLHVDARLAVNEHASVAIDDEGDDVAAADIADVLRDSAKADQSFHDADDLTGVGDRDGDDNRRLIHGGDVLKCAGDRLSFRRSHPCEIHLLQYRLFQSSRFRLSPLTGGIENAKSEEIAVGRNVRGDRLPARHVAERIGVRRESALHHHDASGNRVELLRVAGDGILNVGGDADGRAAQVFLLERLERIAIDPDQKIVRHGQRKQAHQHHRAEKRPQKARPARGSRGNSGGHSVIIRVRKRFEVRGPNEELEVLKLLLTF